MHRFGEYLQHIELFDNWITIDLNLFEQESKYYGYIKLGKVAYFSYYIIKSKEEGKDQESIQSSTTPDLGQHMGK